jgi:hypothetical protein
MTALEARAKESGVPQAGSDLQHLREYVQCLLDQTTPHNHGRPRQPEDTACTPPDGKSRLQALQLIPDPAYSVERMQAAIKQSQNGSPEPLSRATQTLADDVAKYLEIHVGRHYSKEQAFADFSDKFRLAMPEMKVEFSLTKDDHVQVRINGGGKDMTKVSTDSAAPVDDSAASPRR